MTNKVSIYIHIPFCVKKCNYCDFLSFPCSKDVIDKYIDALCEEIKYHFAKIQKSKTKNQNKSQYPTSNIQTIFIGGGTPTLLSIKHFKKIFSILKKHKPKEISIEANPGTINTKQLKSLIHRRREPGFSPSVSKDNFRISLGVQSFNDKFLKILGRIHKSKQSFEAVKTINAAGINNFNIDLMFALPGQTLEDWKKDLRTALSLKPKHISIYNLQIEKGTPFYNTRKKLNLPGEEIEAQMYEFAIDFLKKNGFKHYEISNFAKPGYECQHNLVYWKNKEYIGVGLGAASSINGKRYKNTSSMDKYLQRPTHSRRVVGSSEKDTIFLGLRLIEGIPLEYFKDHRDILDEMIKQGLLEIRTRSVSLTKKGLLLANVVFERFI